MTIMKLNLGSAQFKANPVDEVQRLQAQGEAVWANFPFLGKVAATTRADIAEYVLTQSELFVSEPKNAGQPWKKSIVPGWMPRSVKALGDNMVVKDDPDHRRLRGLVDMAFAKRSVLELEPIFQSIAEQLVDGFRHGLATHGRVDFIDAVAKPMPILAMVAMLGLPKEDVPQFKQWAQRFANLNGLWEFWLVTRSINQMRAYVRTMVQHRRYGDPQGLIAALVEAEASGDRLSEDELTTMLVVLMTAGFETTSHLINGCLWVLLTHQDVADRVGSNPDAMKPFLDESLRFISPFVVTKPRLAARDLTLGGLALKQGQMVLPMIICANYDDRLFDDPGSFQLDRPNASRHMSFGRGIHNCLGRLIARAQTTAVINAVTKHCGHLVSDGPVWAARPGSRNMKSLIVTKG